MRKTIVNSWDEFAPLKHVIVGVCDHACIPAKEPAADLRPPVDSAMKGRWGPRPLERVEKANKQLDDFAALLEKRGIRVDRPTPLQWNQPVMTPDFKTECMFDCMPPRDVLLTIGNEILTVAQSWRSRYFEYLCYWPLLLQYFKEDPNFKWEQAPRPRLIDKSYRKDYGMADDSMTTEERAAHAAKLEFVLSDYEPLSDAADTVRFGKDLFVQISNTTNENAVRWMRRHFPDLRIHMIDFPTDIMPQHIDGNFIPLRPGLILGNPDRPLPEEQREIFKKNDWEIVVGAKMAHEKSPPLCFCSIWVGMNMFSIDHKAICVEASEVYLMEQLDKLGMEVVPVPLRDVYEFGGGLHCCTADVYREGKCEDFFPVQLKGSIIDRP